MPSFVVTDNPGWNIQELGASKVTSDVAYFIWSYLRDALFRKLDTPKMDALVDIDNIQVSETHQCIQKLTILLDDGETFFDITLSLCQP